LNRLQQVQRQISKRFITRRTEKTTEIKKLLDNGLILQGEYDAFKRDFEFYVLLKVERIKSLKVRIILDFKTFDFNLRITVFFCFSTKLDCNSSKSVAFFAVNHTVFIVSYIAVDFVVHRCLVLQAEYVGIYLVQ
jgi:hypothetical protein